MQSSDINRTGDRSYTKSPTVRPFFTPSDSYTLVSHQILQRIHSFFIHRHEISLIHHLSSRNGKVHPRMRLLYLDYQVASLRLPRQ
jgi:hypothetical protein